MSDPVYTYRKDTGWSLTTFTEYKAVDINGRHWLIIDRPPNDDEYFLIYGKHETDWFDGEKLLEQGPVEFMKTDIGKWNTWSKFTGKLEPEELLCTVIPL